MLFLIVTSDWTATSPHSMHTISPNTSNQNFEIALLFNIVERFRNYVFEALFYALGAYKVFFYRKNGCTNFGGGSLDW